MEGEGYVQFISINNVFNLLYYYRIIWLYVQIQDV